MTFFNPRKLDLAQQRELAADQHDDFIALIEMGDADAAAKLAVSHWELSRAQIESFVTPESLHFPLDARRVPRTREELHEVRGQCHPRHHAPP